MQLDHFLYRLALPGQEKICTPNLSRIPKARLSERKEKRERTLEGDSLFLFSILEGKLPEVSIYEVTWRKLSKEPEDLVTIKIRTDPLKLKHAIEKSRKVLLDIACWSMYAPKLILV